MALDPLTAGMDLIGKAIDRFVPDPAQAAQAKLAMYQAEREDNLKEVQTSMSAILAEAGSADPWTSRARPSFLYVVYILLLWGLPMSIVFAFWPEKAAAIAQGFKLWLAAIPDSLYLLFGTVMTGYGVQRTIEKVKGVA
jgi:Na+-transporting methylmalonyl-CoA/oxaloacetate decarboxylase gamma subunit